MTAADSTPGETSWFGGRARLVEIERHVDTRGALLPLQLDRLPFAPCRLFTVSGVPAGARRGGHAHRDAQQLLLCLQGRIDLCLRLNDEEVRISLTADGPAVLVGPRIWCQQTYLGEGSVLLALSSEPYDPTSYIEDWRSL